MLAGNKESGKSPSSESTLKKSDFVTRDPISIFSRIKNASDEEEKKKLNQLLETLRKKLPEGFKIGAAVGEGDCFFDSIAQGLNELKDKGLITDSKGFSVKSLRENCKQYAQQANQSRKDSWLGNALKGEGEKFCEYIPLVEFTAEDIENASSGSEIKILKLENAIWGRPEIEGKMICEKYGVKVRTIELRDKEIDGLHVTKGKVGTGNNIIYIVNYRNHFVPLLSNIEKDIKRSIKVSREEAYGNVVGSNSNNISQSYISTPLQDIENPTYKQSGCSRSPVNEDSEFPSDLQDEPRQNELDNTCQTKQYIPHHLIGLMYRLDLSVLCSLRKSTYEHKYPSLSLAFEDSEIDMFSNIVLRYEKKSIHIRIENVDEYYIDNDISYAKLFTKERRSSSINSYFGSFVKHLISKSDSLSNNVEYLIVYTNSGLDLTEKKELKKGRLRNFYPFKFDSINTEECDILKDFLFTNDNTQGSGFYQFLQDEATREELLGQLEFSPAMRKAIKGRKLSQEFEKETKEAFLDKLVLAVNQPNREELNNIVKNEIKKNSKVQDDYIALQERILCDLTAPEKDKKLKNYISGVIYEFNLLILFLHEMFLNKNMLSISFEEKSRDTSNNITINYKDRVTYVKAHNADSNIGYDQLFPSRQHTFSINKHLTLFVEELKEDTKYFIIYTNAGLDLTEEKKLKEGRSKDFYSFKFDSIDIQKKRYKVLRDCSCINENGLYRFVQEETTREKLLSLLKLPPSLQKEKEEGGLSNESEREIKEKFLDKLIFAVNQPNREILNSVIKSEIDKSNVPYNYEKLHEVVLRWSESHEFSLITEGIIKKLLEDIKNNRSSYQEIQNKDIDEEIKFAKSVVGKKGTPAFNKFLNFLIKEKRLEILKRKGINLTNMSSILSGAGANAPKAFKDLYDLWFDAEGNKTQYLKTLEENGINLTNMSSILNRARADAAKAFKDLYDFWFDEQGNKTQYLKTLEENGINLTNMSSILGGVGANAAKAFKDLYNLWFDAEGNKTQYLKTLEENGINLATMSSILNRVGANAAKAFKDLYNLWFDEDGNKTQYLKTLEEEGISLTNMSNILHGVGTNAATAFKNLYNLWFDVKGNKTQHLKILEEKGIDLTNMSSILGGSGTNIATAFKDLYDLWLDEEGNKTQCLKTLDKEGVSLTNMSNILGGAGANAATAFKNLYYLWFGEEGNKTQYLKTLEKEGINLANISSILHGVETNAVTAFKDLYGLWFDEEGNKTQYLKTLEEKGINLTNMSSILNGAGVNAAAAFKSLYDLWFDEEGNKTQYLKILEKDGMSLTNISSILHGAGANASKAFKELLDTFFDEQGNRKQHLKHFSIEEKGGKKSFKPSNLSGILSKAGTRARYAFEKLHNVCFNDEGKRTKLLDDFYKAGFRPSNLSSALCGTAARASSILKRLHIVCFNEKREITKLLDDFFKVGFRPGNLCSMLSGAKNNLEKSLKRFHDFCFIGDTKRYLNRFLSEEESFTLSNLSKILHGAGANICPALKNFHDVCFDEKGNETQLLGDFRKAGFTPSDLSNILSMSGNNATFILRNFHKVCFNEENYLNHFLAEKKLFTPKDLSRILHGVGIDVCSIFERLHDLCFDKEGNKTKYLNNLIKNGRYKISDILHEQVKKASPIFLDKQNISKGDKVTNASSNSSGKTEQEQNLGSLQQGDSKIKRKTRKSTVNWSENGQETADVIDDNPETYLSDTTIDNQLTRSPSF
uniref:OTU domain-containing protein n=1 Tax=Glossina austeni TaxID=7395 RepID=A0A1A9VJP2_GLOAU